MWDEWTVLRSLSSTSVVGLFAADYYLVVHSVTSDEFLSPLWCLILVTSFVLYYAVKVILLDQANSRLEIAKQIPSRLETIINEDAMGVVKRDSEVIKAAHWVLEYWRTEPLPYNIVGIGITSGIISGTKITLLGIQTYLVLALALQVTKVFGDDVTAATMIETAFSYWLAS